MTTIPEFAQVARIMGAVWFAAALYIAYRKCNQ
jgi:hypothetical protein